MNTVYKFSIQMDGSVFGPYTAREMCDLELLDDILVTEESMNGQWLPAGRFDFYGMAKMENPSRPLPKPWSNRQDVPQEIIGWNWPAFIFGPIWGTCMGIYWTAPFIILGPAAGVIDVILAKRGNEMAWKAKQWDSVEQFMATQRAWMKALKWFGVIFLGLIGFSLFVMIIAIAAS